MSLNQNNISNRHLLINRFHDDHRGWRRSLRQSQNKKELGPKSTAPEIKLAGIEWRANNKCALVRFFFFLELLLNSRWNEIL